MKKTGVIVCSNAALDYIPHEEYIPILDLLLYLEKTRNMMIIQK